MQASGHTEQSVDITPHPRILRMLGEIAFEPHKCIGELIDNSIDSFLNQRGVRDGEEPEITIQVPHRNAIEAGGGRIVIEDNGPGMSLERMTDAARAGYSGNLPVDNLGLFGMGFNIATARLGRTTQLRSGVEDEHSWSIIEIDFNALQQQRNYRVSPRFEIKRANEHGTRITISNLRQEQAIQVAAGISGGTLRSVSGLRNWIGRTYARYVRDPMPGYGNDRLRIVVNGVPAKPYKRCVWGKDRYVELGSANRTGEAEKIYAVQEFDQVLGGGDYCTTCLAWMPPDLPDSQVCAFCRQETLIERVRRMKGWIGVQRHLDDVKFGLDFLRNGRAILQWDKRVFSWTNPNSGQAELEYPIDEPRGSLGRIVGEVEIDHVPVHYQKDSFEEEHPLWHEVIENLRGVSPLRPQIAQQRGFAPNRSLLAQIYRGFNRTRREEGGRVRGSVRGRRTPWARDLIINQDEALRYYERFLQEDPEYQSDDKWYEWMAAADLAREQESPDPDNGGTEPTPVQGPPGPAPRSEQDELRETSELDEALSGTYGFEPARDAEVSVYRTSTPLWLEVRNVRTGVPIKAFPNLDGTIECFYDPTHPRLEDDADEIAELIVSEVSLLLKGRYYDRFPYSYVLGPIRGARLDRMSPADVEVQARKLIADLVPRLIQTYSEAPDVVDELKQLLSDNEIRILSRLVAESGGDQNRLEVVLAGGEFLMMMPTTIGRLVREYPYVFLDRLLFALPYSTLPQSLSESVRQELATANVERVANLLDDIAGAVHLQPFESRRLQTLSRKRVANSLELLREVTVAT